MAGGIRRVSGVRHDASQDVGRCCVRNIPSSGTHHSGGHLCKGISISYLAAGMCSSIIHRLSMNRLYRTRRQNISILYQCRHHFSPKMQGMRETFTGK